MQDLRNLRKDRIVFWGVEKVIRILLRIGSPYWDCENQGFKQYERRGQDFGPFLIDFAQTSEKQEHF